VNHFARRALGPARTAGAKAVIGLAACGSAALITACGSAASSHSAGAAPAPPVTSASAKAHGGPLAGKSVDAIVTAALANTQAASSVRMRGAGTDAGKGLTFDLTLVRGRGCEGTLSMSKAQTFRLIYLGHTVWMKPSDAFYASLGGNKAALALLEGKYIKVKSTDSLVGNINNLCSLSGLLGTTGPTSGRRFAAQATTYKGQPVLKMTQPDRAGYAYISDTARPMLLFVTEPGASGGSIAFTDYNAAVTITPPPAAQTIDGSKFGF
jgi:hypothetical protein